MSRWDPIYERFFGKPRASDDPYADPDLAEPYPFPNPPAPGVDPASERENDQERINENPLDQPVEGCISVDGIRPGWWTPSAPRSGLVVSDARPFVPATDAPTEIPQPPAGVAVLERPVDSQAYVDADQEIGL